jgi:signal transduction histidine kinase
MIAYVSGDVTEEHRRAEESRDALLSALHAAEQASAAKGEFLSRMSHDIRTPLNAIIGYIEMSLESPAIGSDIRDYLS